MPPKSADTKPTGPKVIVPKAVHDGDGGHFPVGHVLDADEKTLASLRAKGLIE